MLYHYQLAHAIVLALQCSHCKMHLIKNRLHSTNRIGFAVCNNVAVCLDMFAYECFLVSVSLLWDGYVELPLGLNVCK